MRKLSRSLLAAGVAGVVLAAAIAPAAALGGCGPNAHRGWGGRCYFGGQNQAWCLRHTGHPATRMPNGEMVCFR